MRRSLGASPSPENFTLSGVEGGGGGRYLTRSCLRAFRFRSLAKKRPPRSVATPDASLLHLSLPCLYFALFSPFVSSARARAFSVYSLLPTERSTRRASEIARESTRRDATDDTLVNGKRDPPPCGKGGLRAETLSRVSRRAVSTREKCVALNDPL